MPYYPHPDWEDIQKHIYIKGIITSVDSENDTADVTVPGGSDGSGVPIFYHCSDDAEERINGAIEGGAAAFSAGTDDPEDGDEVIVMCEADTGLPIRIIGFVAGIKQCGFVFKITRLYDSHVVTDAMTFDDYWYADDWSWGIPNFSLKSNTGSQTVFYGDEEWWEEHDMEEDWGTWEDYHPNGLYVRYNEETQQWTVPIPEEIRDSAGYLVTIGITYSINTQFLTPVVAPEPEPDYPYVWKRGENNSDDPYKLQIYEDDPEHEGYMNLAQPGSYDFPVPFHRIVSFTKDPSLQYERITEYYPRAYGLPLPCRDNDHYYWGPSEFTRTTSWEGDLPCTATESYKQMVVGVTGFGGCTICQSETPSDPCYPVRLAGSGTRATVEVVGAQLSASAPVDPVSFSVGESGSTSIKTTLSYPSLPVYRCNFWYQIDGWWTYEQIDTECSFDHFSSEEALGYQGNVGVGIDWDTKTE